MDKHVVAINIEKCKIGCYYCDEWEKFYPTKGFSSNSELICKLWLSNHLKKIENKVNKEQSMRTIIAGSRSIYDYQFLLDAIDECGWTPTTVISGAAKGADNLGEDWAYDHKVPCELFPADWNKFGKSAGYRRNVQMAENADALIALWDGQSRGTKHMIDIAKSKGLKIYVKVI